MDTVTIDFELPIGLFDDEGKLIANRGTMRRLKNKDTIAIQCSPELQEIGERGLDYQSKNPVHLALVKSAMTSLNVMLLARLIVKLEGGDATLTGNQITRELLEDLDEEDTGYLVALYEKMNGLAVEEEGSPDDAPLGSPE